MNKLRVNQVSIVLLLNTAFTFICQNDAFTVEGIFGTLLGSATLLLLSLPLVWCYRRGFSFSRYAQQHRVLPLLVVAYCLIRGGISFLRIQHTGETLALPVTGKLMAAALIALVCLYTASLGIQALARSSTLIFGILLFTLAVMLIGAIPQAAPQNIAFSPDDTIWKSFLRTLSVAEELPLLFLLLDFVKKPNCRIALHLWIGKFLIFLYIALLSMAVLGSRMKSAPFPFFAATAVSQPFSTQRADALYFVLFVLLSVFRITLYTVLSAHLLRLTLPQLLHTSSICLVVMLAISWASAQFSLSPLWHIPILLGFAGIVPLYFSILQKRGACA